MKTKLIFQIILKVMGVSILFDVICSIPVLILQLFYEYSPILNTILTLSIIAFQVLFAVFLLFKAHWITDILRLSEKMEQSEVPVGNLTMHTIIQLALVILSLYLLFLTVPDLLANLVYLFKNTMHRNSLGELLNFMGPKQADKSVLVGGVVNMILALLVIFKSRKLSDLLTKSIN